MTTMKKEKTYFIGFVKAGNKVIVQMRKDKDSLSCETWIFWGERINTKANLKKHKKELLHEINASYKKDFKYIQID